MSKESPEGGCEAAALNHSILTEADDWDQLKLNIKVAVSCHFEDEDQKLIRLHFVKDELMTV
ncbi:MAG: 2-oxoisovalerate dehydrogenase [Saprospiraceae bacterium]|nr:hypothetical protein [Candidatus Brachybacter algidus]MBL0119562.1 2-oxoisovalerate dehydrogenase [Candidatus Brachybacter algidus]